VIVVEGKPTAGGAPLLYSALKERERSQNEYSGKLILRSSDVRWEESPQGRNAILVDGGLTGLDCRSFGVLLTEIPPKYMSGLHQHSFEAVAYILRGTGHEVIGDSVIPWETGDTLFLPPNIPHRHVNASDTATAQILQIEGWPLMGYLRALSLTQLENARPRVRT
jgi:quercetin dioxygenase-like cupin family protein